jgi:hypothetical protein
MSKLTCATAMFALCFAGCGGGENSASGPAKDPSGVEMEFHEPEGDDSTEAPESESAESERTESDQGQADAEQEEAPPPKAKEPQKSCDGLGQKTCEITVGCAWSTDKKCVEQ